MDTIKLKNDRQKSHFLRWIDQEISEAQEKLNDLVDLKNQVLNETPTEEAKPKKVYKKLGWRDICRKAIDEAGTFLTTADIYKKAAVIDPARSGMKRNKIITSLSAALSGLVKTDEISRFEHPSVQGYFYGRKKWLAENGLPIEEQKEKLRKEKGLDFDISFFENNKEAKDDYF